MTTDVGRRIRGARERKGWSQEHLAAVSGVSTRQIQRIEAERSSPSGETLQALASALGTEVSQLRTGFTEQDIQEFREEHLCPHCGSKLVERSPIHHEYGVEDVEIFECGYTRGIASRPCPTEPRFPKFQDYELAFQQEADRWWCYPMGRTAAARQVSLQIGCGATREEAAKWVERSFIQARDGNNAAQAFLRI